MKKTGKQTTTQEAAEVHPSFVPVLAAFAKDQHVGRGKPWSPGNVVLTVNGRIFAMLVKGTFVAKVPKERVDQLVRDGKGEHFDAGRGRPMKEWVAVRGAGARWVELAKEAQRFVKGGNP